MEAVVVIGLAVMLLWLLDRVGLALANGAVVGLVRGFAAWLGGKLDPWPRGVQEGDRDRPWGRALLPPRIPTLPEPDLSRVRPAVHVR